MQKTAEELFNRYFSNAENYFGIKLQVHFEELKNNMELISEIESAVVDVDSFQKTFNNIYEFRLFRALLYSIMREKKPITVVETGVMHGLSSKFILAALRKNGSGKLISVDYPSYFETGPANNDGYNYTLPKGKEPGWILNDQDKKYWEFHKGKSMEKLPGIFNVHKEIDIFIHDSEHTYETMWNELSLAWEHLRSGGICICDNIESNSSFFDFCLKNNRTPIVFPAPGNDGSMLIRFAMIRK
jgi:predicted O-methyltransferase YrrM